MVYSFIISDDDFALKVGLGVGITMFVLLCAILGCCCYWLVLARRRKRRRKRKRRYVREYDSSSS
jgi:Flp pilus assembly protein TadB